MMENSIFLAQTEADFEILQRLGLPCAHANGDDSYISKCSGNVVYIPPVILSSDHSKKVQEIVLQLKDVCPKILNITFFKYGSEVCTSLDKFVEVVNDDEAAKLYLDCYLLGEESNNVIQCEVPKELHAEMRRRELDFPTEAMSGVAGDFARLYSQYLESPAEFFYFAFLTHLGTVLSGRLTAQTELNPQPRLFTLILGESADDRKSTSISKTSDFFKEALTKDAIRQSWGVGSAEGLAGLFDTNIGGATRVLMLCDEFKSFVSKCMIEASVLLPCVNTLFESNVFHSRTKNSAITIDDAHLSILAASTTQTFERCWTPAFRDIGFNNRLWLVPGSAQQRFSIPITIPREEKMRLRIDLSSILALVGDGIELPFTLEARRLFDGWYQARERSIHMKRLDVYAIRLMLLLAVNDLRDHIDEETAGRAIKLCRWQLAVRRAFDPIDAENSIARMESEIIRQLTRKGPLTKREAQQATNANRVGVWTFDTALRNLEKDGRVSWGENKKINLNEGGL